MELNDIPRLRDELRQVKQAHSLTAMREEFEARKALEWAAIRESHSVNPAAVIEIEQRLAQTVSDLFNAGVSKRSLCKAYGTQDYGTINRLIAKGLTVEKPSSLKARLDDELTAEHGVDIWLIDAINYGADEFTGSIRVYSDSEGYPTVVGEVTDDFRGTQLHQETAGSASGDFQALWESLARPSGV